MQDKQNHEKSRLILFLIVIILLPLNAPCQTVLFTINSEPVFEEEFAFFTRQNRAMTSSYFYTNYKAEQGPEFWTSSYSGEVPLKYIYESTLKQLIKIKANLSLAKELGIISNTSFEAFRNQYYLENARRKELVKNKVVIYGSIDFSMESYFSYWYSNLTLSTEKAWKSGRNVNTDSLRNYYLSHISDYKKSGQAHIPKMEDIKRVLLTDYLDEQFLLYMSEQIKTTEIEVLLSDSESFLLKYLE